MQGKKIEKFILHHLIGEGGLAEVWYAENNIGLPAAVKILKRKFCEDESIVQRFENEARVMVKLSHPHVRKVLGYDTVDARPAILMEYLEGEDLSQKLAEENSYTQEDLIRWWDAAVEALRYTHAQEVVHRDIKPSNFFITKEGKLKLLDFGISKVGDNLTATKTGTVMGTPLYMSPEQVIDSKNIDYRSDVYSLAVSFFQLLTRQKPYGIEEEDSLFHTQQKIVNNPLDLSLLSSPWRTLLSPLLEKKAELRSEPQLFSELKKSKSVVVPTPPLPDNPTIIDSRPLPSTPEPKENEPSQPKKKRTTWIIATLLLVFLALLGMFVLKDSDSTPDSPKPEPIVINTDSIIRAESARAEALVASDIDQSITIYAELEKKYPDNKEIGKRKVLLQKKKTDDIEEKSKFLTSKEEAINVFRELVRIEPIHCLVTMLDSKESIVCIANKTGLEGENKMSYKEPEILFYKLTKFANNWRVEKKFPLFTDEYVYCDFYKDYELVRIDNKPYLYFLYQLSYMGNAISDLFLCFNLFSLSDYQLSTLVYGGAPYYNTKSELQYIKGDFTNLDALSSKPDILSFLENIAAESPLIYHPTPEDLDMNNVKNYDKKWQIDNSSVKSVWEVKKSTTEEPIKFSYYKERLFDPNEEDSKNKIENNSFIIVSFFRSNILAYDKNKKLYFPIWIDGCATGCNKDIAFIDETTLVIKYIETSGKKIIIDLKKMTYRISIESSADAFDQLFSSVDILGTAQESQEMVSKSRESKNNELEVFTI